MAKATNDSLAELHGQVANYMAHQLKTKTATSSDISNILKFLKDNGVFNLPDVGDTMTLLMESIDEIIDVEEVQIKKLSKPNKKKTEDEQIEKLLKDKTLLDSLEE